MREKQILVILVFVFLCSFCSSRRVKVKYDTEKDIIIYEGEVYVSEAFESNPIEAKLRITTSEPGVGNDHAELTTMEYIVYGLISLGLTLFCGLMSGLTVGYLSIDELELDLKCTTGTEDEKRQAKTILSILKYRHWLLVTLLISNASASEALPIFLHKLVPEYLAIIFSVTLVLIFGEIVPQAVCTGSSKLKIAKCVAPLVWFLLYATAILSWPISKIIDCLLGEHSKSRFLNTDLKALIDLHTYNALNKIQDELDHGHGHGHGKKHGHFDMGIDEEQANLMISAIEMHEIRAEDIMKDINRVYSLSIDTIIDSNAIMNISSKGYSRVPIYKDKRENLVGFLKINSLIKIDPDSKKSIKELGLDLYAPVILTPDTSVYECLQALRKGKSQMAFITCRVDDLKKNVVQSPNFQDQLANTNQSHVHNQMFDPPSQSHDSYRDQKIKISIGGDRSNTVFNSSSHFDLSSSEILGIITLEDVIERLIKIDIYDEEDYITKKARASVFQGRSTSRFSIKEQQINLLVSKELTKSLLRDESMKLNSILSSSVMRTSNI